jgi:formylglycine-generating enzyme required for sulfatase activity
MLLVLIPPGGFEMGSTPEEVTWALADGKKTNQMQDYLGRLPSEGPRHRVKISKPFCLGM